jgi:hypothetical protein
MVGRAGRDQRHAEALEMIVTGELHCEVAGEPVGALDNDGAHAVGGDCCQHAGEAGSRSHWIAAAIACSPVTRAFKQLRTGPPRGGLSCSSRLICCGA